MNLSMLHFTGIGLASVSVGVFSTLAARFLIQRIPQSLPRIAPQTSSALPRFQVTFTPSQALLAGGLALSLGVMAFADFSTGFLLMVLVMGSWWAVERGPSFKKKREAKKKQGRMEEVFPQTLGMSVQALKTGQTLPQVLDYLSRECPHPLQEELTQVCAEMNLGVSAEESLSKMAGRYPDFTAFHQFLESYKISRQTGANLTHLLEVLLEGLEEKNRLLRKMDAMTAQARLSGILMGLLPVLLAVVFFCMDPDLMTPLFTQKAGWAILLLAALLETIGFFWIRQLLQLEI